MEEVAYMLVNNANDQRYCEKLLNDFSSRIWYRSEKDMKTKALLYYFLTDDSADLQGDQEYKDVYIIDSNQ